MMAGVFIITLLGADMVENLEEVVLGFYWITLKAIHVDGTIALVLDVEEV